MVSCFLHSSYANDIEVYRLHRIQILRYKFQFRPLRQLLYNFCCYRNSTFPVNRMLSCKSLFFLLEGKIDGTAHSTRFLRSAPSKTLWSILTRNEFYRQIRAVFFISKVSASAFLLYWLIVFFQTLKRAIFSWNLKNLMTDFCLCLLYEALPH